MPYYDYECTDCGPFTELREMADYDKPCDCPECGSSARRAYFTAPYFAGMSRELRVAHATNEKSAHEPSTLEAYKAKHRPGCSCCSGKKSRMTYRGKNGSKTFPKSRPWMISH